MDYSLQFHEPPCGANEGRRSLRPHPTPSHTGPSPSRGQRSLLGDTAGGGDVPDSQYRPAPAIVTGAGAGAGAGATEVAVIDRYGWPGSRQDCRDGPLDDNRATYQHIGEGARGGGGNLCLSTAVQSAVVCLPGLHSGS